jgi:hypothetical protein
MRVDAFLAQLQKVRGSNGHWIACCPAHDDRTPSLTIAEGQDGRVLVHCFGGCPVEAVVGAVGMTLSDLMPEGAPLEPSRKMRIPAPDVLRAMSFSATMVAIYAADMAKGVQLTPEDKAKLFAIAGEFQEAVEYATR